MSTEAGATATDAERVALFNSMVAYAGTSASLRKLVEHIGAVRDKTAIAGH
jgi:hypothetical protein